MFVGRKKELLRLQQLYDNEKFQCTVIYGRRRVGKTTLIREFIKDKKTIYFAGLETTEQNNLENFSKSIFELSMEGNAVPTFQSFSDAFSYLGGVAQKERIILVIDEFPYLANAVKGISSILQKYIDLELMESKLFIILCGSSMSFMENQVLGYQSPLYGRRTAQFKIEPFDFFEMRLFYHSFSIYDLALIYGIMGGIPQYLQKIDENSSMKDNITLQYLTSDAYLFEEPSNLLKQELREPQIYNAVITAIANGSSKLNEISTKVGLTSSAAIQYLTSLMSLGIVKKEYPITEKKSKKTIYALADNMFRFWYRFIPKYNSIIQKGFGEKVYSSIELELNEYMGAVFEEICMQYLWKLFEMGKLPFEFEDVGRWWGNNPKKKVEQEIDILAYCDTSAIFGECKWRNELFDVDIYLQLKEKSDLFFYENKYFYLFSKSGFTNKMKELAMKDERIILIGMDNIENQQN